MLKICKLGGRNLIFGAQIQIIVYCNTIWDAYLVLGNDIFKFVGL